MTGTPPHWPDRDWVTPAELAAIAEVHYDTVRREIRRGNLRAERPGRELHISRTEAERWLMFFEKYNSLRKDPQ